MEREIFWIEELKTLKPNGYNLTIGGSGSNGFKHTEKSRIKISLNHADISGEKNPMYGKHHSEESKSKMRKPHRRKYNEYPKKQKFSEENSFFGHKHTEEFKKNLASKKAGGKEINFPLEYINPYTKEIEIVIAEDYLKLSKYGRRKFRKIYSDLILKNL